MNQEESEIEKIKLRVDDATISSSGAVCPKCSLELAPGLTVCPNDGHQMVTDYKPGNKIGGKYTFIEPLGTGGMSSVYKATDQILDRVVAVKMLHSHLSQNESMLKRFRQEGRAISQLNHPNIVRVLEFGVLEQGQPFIVTDYIHGESLERMIKRGGPLPARTAVRIVKQIVEALDHAHTRGVLHRDLKPSNVMISVDDQGQPLATLVDFGIAKVTASEEAARLTATGEVFGSPMYMSPEQARGLDVDARSDLYSLGCLMYETLTGTPVFEGTNPLEIIFNKLNREPPSLQTMAGIPQTVRAIVDRLLQADPGIRYQTAQDLLADLNEESSDVSPVRVTIQTSPRPQSKDIFARLSTPKGLLVVAIVMAVSLMALGQLKSPLVSNEIPDAVTTSGTTTDKTIKATLNDLATKESIDLSNTDLSDAGLQWLGKAPNLKSVNLNSTKITTIAPLAGLPLRELWLRNDAVADAGMRAVGDFSQLRTLDLANTKITDATGPQLSGLKQLQVLGVDNTQVTDRFIASLPPNLKWLSLNGTQITNKTIEELPRFKQLEGVTLDGLSVDAKTSELLARMPQLQQIYLRSESINDKTAEALSQLKNLRELSLAAGNLTDQGVLALVSSLPRLEMLALDSSHLTNSCLPLFASTKSLTKLNIAGNKITDDGIDALNMAEHLHELDLSDTQVTASGLLKLNVPGMGLKRLRIHGIKLTPEQLQKLQSQNVNTVIESN